MFFTILGLVVGFFEDGGPVDPLTQEEIFKFIKAIIKLILIGSAFPLLFLALIISRYVCTHNAYYRISYT